MAVDPRIAMGFQAPQIASPMDLAQNAFALKGAMQQNALAEAKMAEMQRQQQSQNALRQLFAGGKMPDAAAVYAIDPELGGAYEKSQQDIRKSRADADLAYWNRQRDTASRLGDQSSWSAWRGTLPTEFQGYVPAQFSPENKRMTLATADKALEMFAPKIQFQDTASGVEGIDVSPDSPTFGQTRIRRGAAPKAPGTVVNLPGLPKKEQESKGELNVEIYKGIRETAARGRKTEPAIDTALAVLDKGFGTGTGTATTAKIAGVLSALGVPEATAYASDAAVFQATVQQTVLDRQFEQKGPQTEADAARITQTAANLGNPTDANRFLLNIAKAQAKRDIAQQRFFDKWWNTNKTYEGAEEAWISGEGSKSLFSDPALSKYAPKEERPAPATTTPAATPVAPPKIGTVRNGYKFKGGNPGVSTNWEKI
jgi:hypothetical protein